MSGEPKPVLGGILVVLGLLVAVTPRYIFPVCEFTGKPVMKCSVTGHWEMVAGAVLSGAGILWLLFRTPGVRRLIALVTTLAGVAIIQIPSMAGYCPSPRMPCHYGTVPAMKIQGAIVILVGVISLWNVFRDRTVGRSL